MPCSSAALHDLRTAPTTPCTAAAWQDRTVRLWNPHRGIPIKAYTGHGYDVRDAAVVADNSKSVAWRF